MPCLYVTHFHHRDFTVIKFGISKEETSGRRLFAHAMSKDNPFGSRMNAVSDLCVTVESERFARDLEQVLCMHMRWSFPWTPYGVARHDRVRTLALCPAKNPSGEWLMSPLDALAALRVFFLAAVNACEAYAESQYAAAARCGEHIFARALEALDAGRGYERYVLTTESC